MWKEVDQAGDKSKENAGRKTIKGHWLPNPTGSWTGQHYCEGFLSEERYGAAVLDFLRATKVGKVKEGVIVR